jgi:hypothetical protein
MTKSSLPNLIGFMTNIRLKNANNLSGRQIIYIQKTSGISAAKRYYSRRPGCVKQKVGCICRQAARALGRFLIGGRGNGRALFRAHLMQPITHNRQ